MHLGECARFSQGADAVWVSERVAVHRAHCTGGGPIAAPPPPNRDRQHGEPLPYTWCSSVNDATLPSPAGALTSDLRPRPAPNAKCSLARVPSRKFHLCFCSGRLGASCRPEFAVAGVSEQPLAVGLTLARLGQPPPWGGWDPAHEGQRRNCGRLCADGAGRALEPLRADLGPSRVCEWGSWCVSSCGLSVLSSALCPVLFRLSPRQMRLLFLCQEALATELGQTKTVDLL